MNTTYTSAQGLIQQANTVLARVSGVRVGRGGPMRSTKSGVNKRFPRITKLYRLGMFFHLVEGDSLHSSMIDH